MSLISIIIILAVIGFIVWLINTQVPQIDAKFKTIINWVVVIVVIWWLLSLVGVIPDLNTIRVG